jgi:hypothetical protein
MARISRAGALGLLASAVLLTLLLGAAQAAPLPQQLTQFGEWGNGAGQTEAQTAIAADAQTGHLYVGESGGARVSEFTAWGEFVRAWGWGVLDGSPELQICTAASGCGAALHGSGAGQFEWANGVAVAPDGSVYVFDRPNLRVQKFDAEGHFLLMFGGGVNKTTGASVCTEAQLEAGNECGAGVAGSGDGAFAVEGIGVSGNYISVGQDGTVYVGDRNRVQEFNPNGSFKAEFVLPQPGQIGALALAPGGDVYVAYAQDLNAPRPGVLRLDPSGGLIETLAASVPDAIATDAAGDLFVLDRTRFGQSHPEVLEYGPSGEELIPSGSSFTSLPSPDDEHVPELALGTNVVTSAGGVDVYTGYTNGATLEFTRVFGPPPDKWAPPSNPPAVDAQFATSVGTDRATVKAQINPRFWADTSFHVEYGTSPCSGGGCTREPATGEIELGTGIVNRDVATEGIALSGLSAETTYRFRFVSQSSGGGPTIGQEGTFETFGPTVPNESCPNQAFRKGAAAFLPDCRAYEMVSPPQKEGGEALALCNASCFQARLDQAAGSGDAMTFSSYRAFADAEAAPWSSQYIARRGPAGWVTESISPPQEGPSFVPGPALDNQFKGFLEDLSAGWLLTSTEPVLASGGVPGFANLYGRAGPAGTYSALTTAAPPATPVENYIPELQGFSADGSHAVFRANAKLSADAAPGTGYQLYDFSGGEPRLVSVLPGGAPSASASAGTGEGFDGRSSSLLHAVSEDGSKIYWSAFANGAVSNGPGKLFVRLDGTVTLPVSGGSKAIFWGAAADGSRAIYDEGGSLFEFDLEANSRTEIAGQVLGVMGMSEDARRVYFASQAALAAGATAGKPNLYWHEAGGSTHLVATLANEDLANSTGLSPVEIHPFNRTGSVSADGSEAVFMSRARLTGFDNTDQASGEPDAEVFLYETAGGGELHCVSCNRSGARPSGRRLKIRNGLSAFWAAGAIPTWESQLHAPRVLSADGGRLFFESTDALVARDANGVQDVYQWERPGSGECTAQSSSFELQAGGCIGLISDGESPRDAEFIDAGSDGRDVFFGTAASYVSADPAQLDVYDARLAGGFPEPPGPPAECEGEACQGTVAPPALPAPQTTISRPGNPKPPTRHRRRHRRRHAGGHRKPGRRQHRGVHR